ncbi:MAG: hypothetical protein V4850_28610 [Myxococcota bacterium]
MLTVLLVLSACADPPGPAPEQPRPPSAWTYTPEADPAPPLTVAELEQGLDEVVDALVTTRPTTVTDLFDEAMTHRGDDCPASEENGAQTMVAGDCTTDDGWSWYGVGAVSHLRNFHVVLGEIDNFHYVWHFSTGNVQVIAADGRVRYELLGTTWYRDYEGDTGRALSIELWGEFQGIGTPTFDDTWIVEDRAVELYVELQTVSGGWEGTWSAGMSRLPGVVWAFSFGELAVSAACAEEPTGALELQDQAGTWHTVVFDGDTECDGCGVAWVGDTEIGAVCADLSPLVEFEVDPWEG